MMLNLLTGLDTNKYDIYVISKPNGPLVEKVLSLGYTHIPVKFLTRELSVMDFAAFIELIRIFRKYNFDILHTHSSKTGFLGRIGARITGVRKIVHTVHGFPFHKWQNVLVSSLYKALDIFAAFFSDYIVTMNESNYKLAIDFYPVSNKKIYKIYNGVKLNRLKRVSNSKKICVGWIARFEPQKNPINTVTSAINACLINKDLEFIFIGDGELLDTCKRKVKEKDLDNRIKFPGWCTNITDWLREFDIFLLYSLYEGLPLSILEAMSTGLPVIGADIDGINELVNDENGYLIDANDNDKLTDFLVNLPERTNEFETKGNNSVSIVKEKFSREVFISKYEQLYSA